VIEKALKLNPELRAFAGYLASAYAHLGRDDEAKAAAQTFRRGSPRRHTVAALPPARLWMSFYPFKDRGVADSFFESLKRAGYQCEMVRCGQWRSQRVGQALIALILFRVGWIQERCGLKVTRFGFSTQSFYSAWRFA
jgi:hypothetical protein